VPYFEIAELREIPDVSDPVKFPDARLTAARAWIEAIIERHVGTSFVDRARVRTVDGDGRSSLLLPGYARSVTSVTVSGLAVTEFVLSSAGILTLTAGTFTYGTQNVVVTYIENATPAGVPEDLKWAALEAARYKLKERDSRISSRTLSEFDGEGGTTRFAIPSEDRPTGLPDVDAVINGYRAEFRLPAIA
jgi:hypothetical protein